jgi:hypothetical protein
MAKGLEPGEAFFFVIPAKAGIHGSAASASTWIPAFAGTTSGEEARPSVQ